MGRPPIGDRAMTSTERSRRWRSDLERRPHGLSEREWILVLGYRAGRAAALSDAEGASGDVEPPAAEAETAPKTYAEALREKSAALQGGGG
jgi:hypothetical protein